MYLNEYARFMPPCPAGETDLLAANNISYKRTALFHDDGQPRFQVFWKELANRELRAAGHKLWLDPQMVVQLRKRIPFGDFLATRYDNGRCFAGMRAANFSRAKRLLYGAAAPGLPLLLLGRCARQNWAKPRFRARFLITLPLLLLLFAWWSLGELVGYWFGPGDTCETLYY
jgi:hypothetical protein